MSTSVRAALQDATPIIDVRSEGEFTKAAFPQSINLPILNDDERHRVGIAYRDLGAAAATRLGHELVSGDKREQRIERWLDVARTQDRPRLMCWRGGQRSAIAAAWLQERGVSIERIPGGYKALRSAALACLDAAAEDAERSWWVLGGRTGSQKTRLIHQCADAIDLEGLAEHRGSAFGATSRPQPSVATFENRLAVEAVRHEDSRRPLILEDESLTIGRVSIPHAWHQRMQRSPLLLIDADMMSRVAHIRAEYVEAPLAEDREDGAAERLAKHYVSATHRIARRLGGVRHKTIVQLITDAFDNRLPHDEWIRFLLEEYYDPMYDYQIAKKENRILYRGDYSAVAEYIEAHAAQ